MSPEARVPSGMELFGEPEEDRRTAADFSDAESFFNLPQSDADDEDDAEDPRRR